MLNKYWPVLVTWVTVFLLYFPFLSVFFTGDDFFHFHVASTNGTVSEFAGLFGFFSFAERGIAFYRPLFREAIYNIYYSLYGLESLPFRLTQLALHFVNILLVFTLFQKLFGKKPLSAFTAFFYGITAAQVGSLYYLAGGIQAQGATLFMLSSLIFYMKHVEGGKLLYWRASLVAFVLGLASHELAIVTVFLLVGLEWINSHKESLVDFSKKVFRNLWPFGVIALVYLYLNIFVIGFSESEAQYQPTFSPFRAANTFFWYLLWSVGIPEMLVDFVAPGFRLLPNLMIYWGSYFRIIFPAFLVVVSLLTGIFIYLLIKNREVLISKKFLFVLAWFPLALLPVIFLPVHKKTYYLATALPALWGIIGYLVVNFYDDLKKKGKRFASLVVGLLCIFLFILSFTSIKLSDETYWAAKRGRLAKKLLTDIKNQHPTLPKGSTIYIKNDPKYPEISGEWGGTSTQAGYILNGSDALRLVYNDYDLVVYYEDLIEDTSFLGKEVLEFTAALE